MAGKIFWPDGLTDTISHTQNDINHNMLWNYSSGVDTGFVEYMDDRVDAMKREAEEARVLVECQRADELLLLCTGG